MWEAQKKARVNLIHNGCSPTWILTTRLLWFIERLISFKKLDFVKGCNIVEKFPYASDVIRSCQVQGTLPVVLKLDLRRCLIPSVGQPWMPF
jgi:hypothetical protein